MHDLQTIIELNNKVAERLAQQAIKKDMKATLEERRRIERTTNYSNPTHRYGALAEEE